MTGKELRHYNGAPLENMIYTKVTIMACSCMKGGNVRGTIQSETVKQLTRYTGPTTSPQSKHVYVTAKAVNAHIT